MHFNCHWVTSIYTREIRVTWFRHKRMMSIFGSSSFFKTFYSFYDSSIVAYSNSLKHSCFPTKTFYAIARCLLQSSILFCFKFWIGITLPVIQYMWISISNKLYLPWFWIYSIQELFVCNFFLLLIETKRVNDLYR